MKVKVVHRDPEEFHPERRRLHAVRRVCRNADAALHPLEKARELQRAIVATKMEKMFAKPLVGVLDGHRDSVRCMARCHSRLTDIFTGSCDGILMHWDIAKHQAIRSIRAHEGFVRGLAVNHEDTSLLSCGDDGIVKMWSLEALKPLAEIEDEDAANDQGHLVALTDANVEALGKKIKPVKLWTAENSLTSIDYHWSKPFFATTGETVDVWDLHRSSPIHSFDWSQSSDPAVAGRFNPADPSLIAVSGADNVVGLFDLRTSSAIRKVLLKMRTNAVCWNPMKPLNFVCANEDHNLYSFDMRNLEKARVVHKDFTNAVLDVDFSPTGTEFVASSFDRTARIFEESNGRSRDIYHGKRMQIVLACRYSADARYVLTGSGDFCVRIWKAKAWEAIGPKTTREKRALAYREALKARYKNVPEVRSILNHHHVPRMIRKATALKRTMREAASRKELNVELHSKPGANNKKHEKKKMICKIQE